MNRIRKIQLFLLVTMLILVTVVILNFNRGNQKKPVKKPGGISLSQNIEAGGTKMEGGVHVLYRNGAPFATVHFKEAIQKKEQLHLSSPVVTITGFSGQLTADSADLKNDVIVLNGKVSLLSPENKISVSLAPPAIFKDGILTGSGAFKLILNGGAFSGNTYVLDINGGNLLGKKNAKFINDGKRFCVRGERGIADLKGRTIAFVRNVRITGEGRNGEVIQADSAFLDIGREQMFLSGAGKTKLNSGAFVHFTEAIFKRNGTEWNAEFPTPVNFIENNRILHFPNAVLRGQKLYFPWSLLKSGASTITSAQGSLILRNTVLNAKSVIFQNEKNNLNVTGKTVRGDISKQNLEIYQPFVSFPGNGWIYGSKGEMTAAHHFEIAGNVTGKIRGRIFTADTAKAVKSTIVLENAVIWDIASHSFSRAKTFNITDDAFSAAGNYQMKQLKQQEKSPLNLSALIATGTANGPIHLRNKVRAEINNLSISALESYVYKWGAVFFGAVFSGKRIKQGKADFLIVLTQKHSAIMLGNADITDGNGNRLQGHKLTLSTITGRISVYSGKKKVRIKLAL